MRNFGVTSMWDSRKRFRAHISMLFGRAALHRVDMLLTNQFTDGVDTDLNMTKTAAAECSFAGCNSDGIVTTIDLVNYCRHILPSAKTFKQGTKADIILSIFGKGNKFGLSSRSSSCGLK